MAHPYSSIRHDPLEARGLVILLLAGPLVWTAHHLTGYLLVELSCRTGLLGGQIFGISVLRAVVIGLTIVALALTLYAGFRAYRNWQFTREDRSENPETELVIGRTRFLAQAGLLLNIIFAAIILLNGIPALFLRLCG